MNLSIYFLSTLLRCPLCINTQSSSKQPTDAVKWLTMHSFTFDFFISVGQLLSSIVCSSFIAGDPQESSGVCHSPQHQIQGLLSRPALVYSPRTKDPGSLKNLVLSLTMYCTLLYVTAESFHKHSCNALQQCSQVAVRQCFTVEVSHLSLMME